MHSQLGFKYAMLSLASFVLAIVLFYFNSELFSWAAGILIFLMGVIAIMGLIYSLRGLKEEGNLKKWLGLIVNVGLVILILVIIAMNVYDIYLAFS